MSNTSTTDMQNLHDGAANSERRLPRPIRESLMAVESQLNEVLKGKQEAIRMVLVCLLARGHLLLEDKPGLGKTTLAKALANCIGGIFARIQCTPDLLPGDITGFNIFNQRSLEFEFRAGPVFADVLLADEINRATPRTQSALLEAMAEYQVTVDAKKYELPEQFLVIATQNPLDHHGTYPLPEAQLDRFAMKLSLGYPSPEDEQKMLAAAIGPLEQTVRSENALLSPAELRLLQNEIRKLHVAESIQRYMIQLGQATRQHTQIQLGASPRALLTWQRVCQARAYLEGRDFVTPDDVQATAVPVLSVRLGIISGNAQQLVGEIINETEVPRAGGTL